MGNSCSSRPGSSSSAGMAKESFPVSVVVKDILPASPANTDVVDRSRNLNFLLSSHAGNTPTLRSSRKRYLLSLGLTPVIPRKARLKMAPRGQPATGESWPVAIKAVRSSSPLFTKVVFTSSGETWK
jgi:hypothetical protein